MNFSDKIENLEYELSAAFESEGFDVTEEDLAGYDDIYTEATVKGTTKKVVAFVVAICKKIVNFIMQWIKNRNINKLVANLKNKIAKFEDNDQKKAWCRVIWAAVKKGSKNGSVGSGDATTKQLMFVMKLIQSLKTADGLVRLNTLLRQIKTTPVEKFNKAIKGVRDTVGSDNIKKTRQTRVTQTVGDTSNLFANIGNADAGIDVAYASLIDSLAGISTTSKTKVFDDNAALFEEIQKINTETYDNFEKAALEQFPAGLLLTKGQCDTIGKSLKVMMACLSNFTLKTMHFYGRQEDEWTMTANQKAVVKILKDTQKASYDAIKACNVLISDVKTDDYNEVDTEESVDLSTMMMDMALANESIDDLITEMNEIGTEDTDFDFEF